MPFARGSSPQPARGADLRPVASSRRARAAAPRWPGRGAGIRTPRPAQHLRRHEAPSGALCACLARESGAIVTALRYHNVYGPRMPRDTPYAGVASIFASALARGERPRVFEDGAQLRDFVHVRDVARANALALRARLRRRALSTSPAARRGRSWRWPVAAAASGGIGAAIEPLVTGEFRLGDVRHVFASAAGTDELGFVAREDFAAGMAEFARAPLRD